MLKERLLMLQQGTLLPGVNIVIEGTVTGTTTAADGSYSINVPGQQSVLVFSFIGMTTQKFIVGNQHLPGCKFEV